VRERNDDGTLTAQGIADMDQFYRDQAMSTTYSGAYDIQDLRAAGGTVKERDKALAAAMKANKNELSGKTTFPEFANLLSGNLKASNVVTKTRAVGGINMQVTYDESDANLKARLKLLDGAVKKIKKKGFQVPPLDVTVPRYGRNLSITDSAIVNPKTGKPDCVLNLGAGGNAAAIYTAPNLMYLGSQGINNPQERMDDFNLPGNLKERPGFVSSQVDMSGMATVVHELGHHLHCAKDPSTFFLLHSTSFASRAADDTAWKVSSYASGNPREFVAEVFTGLIFGKKFPTDVMDMYRGLGGP
jgi:hypothetical protein